MSEDVVSATSKRSTIKVKNLKKKQTNSGLMLQLFITKIGQTWYMIMLSHD